MLRQALDPSVTAIRVGDTTPIRDFTFVEDKVAAFLAIGASGNVDVGTPYNERTGTSVTVGQVIDMVRALAHCEKPPEQEARRLRPRRSEVRELSHTRASSSTPPDGACASRFSRALERTVDWWRGRLAAGRARREREHAT